MIEEMSISRSLKEIISDIPERIGDSIEFTKIEKWKVSKTSLLDQKRIIEKELLEKQSQLDEVNQFLVMFEKQIGD